MKKKAALTALGSALTAAIILPTGLAEEAAEEAAEESLKAAGGPTGAWIFLTVIALYALLFVLVWKKTDREKAPVRNVKRLFPAVFALGFITRVVTMLLVPGYDTDIILFRSWAETMAQTGPLDFYAAMPACDYPPGYMWFLWLVGLAGKAIGTVPEWLLKFPSVLCDMLLCLLLYADCKEKQGEYRAFFIALLYLFNPLTYLVGAAWGQTDALLCLLIYLTVRFALRSKWKFALPMYVAAVLAKPQALMFGPLGLVAFVYHLVRDRKDKQRWTDALLGLVLAVAAFCAFALPFSLKQESDWLFNLYENTMSHYDYASANACNLYFLADMNWMPVRYSPTLAVYVLSCVVPALPPVIAAVLLRNPRRSSALLIPPILLSALFSYTYFTGKLTYALIGTCVIWYTIVLFLVLYLIQGSIENLPLLGAGFLMMMFSAGTMMHERYLFPAIALLITASFVKDDKRLLLMAVLYTVASFLNTGCVLARNIRIGGQPGLLNTPCMGISSDMAWLEYASAVLTLILCMATTFLCCLPDDVYMDDEAEESGIQNGSNA